MTWRILLPADRRDLAELANLAFGLSVPRSYLADFPVWDPGVVPAAHRFQIGGFHGSRLVCSASIRFTKYRFADASEVRFGLIGAVVTHPDFARRGHASEAIDRLIQEGERRGVKDFALWGSESKIYRERKFVFGGKQLRVPIRSLRLPKPAIEGFDFRTGWDSEIAVHLLRRKSGIRYDDSDVLWLSRHSNVEWRTLWLDEKCMAYCAWNRGIDLPNIIHELDGDQTACLTLLKLLQDRYPNLEWITHPETPWRWKISGTDGAVTETLAQFRLGTLAFEKTDKIWFSGMDSC